MKSVLFFFFMLSGICSVVARTNESDSKTIDHLLCDSLQIEVTDMMPVKFPSRAVSGGYGLFFHHDSVRVSLPYVGEVHQAPMGTDGTNFDEPCKKFNVQTTKKKDGWILKFSTHHDIIDYQFSVNLWNNGSMSMSMFPSNGQSCSYSGSWVNGVE